MKVLLQTIAGMSVCFMLLVAATASAQRTPPQQPPQPSGVTPPQQPPQPGPGGSGSADGLSYKLQNPLKFDSLQDFIVAILNVIIVLATPIVVIFIIFAGFKYVTARGNPSEIQEATRALTYAVIGGVLIIGAVAIAEIIKNLVSAFAA
jgi:hypothetical protein